MIEPARAICVNTNDKNGICEECGGQLLETIGEVVCKACGLVQGRRQAATVNNENFKIFDSGQWCAPVSNVGFMGTSVPAKLKHASRHSGSEHREIKAMQRIQTIVNQLNLSWPLQNRVIFIYKHALLRVQVRNHPLLAMVCVIIAVNEAKIPVALPSIMNAARCKMKMGCIRKLVSTVSKSLGIKLVYHGKDYLPEAISRLPVSEAVKQKLVIKVRERVAMLRGNYSDPRTVNAAAIWWASNLVGHYLTQEVVAKATGVSEVSIRTWARKLGGIKKVPRRKKIMNMKNEKITATSCSNCGGSINTASDALFCNQCGLVVDKLGKVEGQNALKQGPITAIDEIIVRSIEAKKASDEKMERSEKIDGETEKQPSFTCAYCPRKFFTKKGVDKHIRVHPEYRASHPKCPKCMKCRKHIPKEEMAAHVATCKQKKERDPITCPKCGKATGPRWYTQHVESCGKELKSTIVEPVTVDVCASPAANASIGSTASIEITVVKEILRAITEGRLHIHDIQVSTTINAAGTMRHVTFNTIDQLKGN